MTNTTQNWNLSKRARVFGAALLATALALPVLGSPAQATPPTFTSGSTGTDGAFAPTTDVTLDLPDDGVFNFTTITIPEGVTVSFRRNAGNTPVRMLATGDCVIEGYIDIAGSDAPRNSNRGGDGGPGGGDGGHGGASINQLNGSPGDGLGGGGGGKAQAVAGTNGAGGGAGFATPGTAGSWPPSPGADNGSGGRVYGSAMLNPVVGGSGGGGGGASYDQQLGYTSVEPGGGGGGGGGGILIASSGSIQFGREHPVWGQSYAGFFAWGGYGEFAFPGAEGGGGSGGAVRVVANAISGGVYVDTSPGEGSTEGAAGLGYARFEAWDFTGFVPDFYNCLASTGEPSHVLPVDGPMLRVASVASVPAPANARGSLHEPPDIRLAEVPASASAILIESANIPPGTVVTVTVTPRSGPTVTVVSTPLSGSLAYAEATASVSIPAGMSVVVATATIDLTGPLARRVVVNGERVTRMDIVARLDGLTELVYVTASGARVRAALR